jgi:AraC-like DNA-binding protein
MEKLSQACPLRIAQSNAGETWSGRAGQFITSTVEPGGEGSGQITPASEPRIGRHLRLEIVRCGRMNIEQNGEALGFGPGDMLLLDAALEFSRSFREPVQISVLYISKQALDDRGVSYRFSHACHPIRETEDIAAVRALLLTFTGYVGNASDALLERLGNQFLDLMDVVIEHSGAAHVGRCTKSVVQRATQLITRRLGDTELSIAAIANELNVSTSSLTRAFRQRGLSPMRYAYALRLEHAARLLADKPALAIKDVACRSGFASPAHLSRLFKKEHGMTPREYANHHASRAQGGATEAVEASETSEA